MMDNIAQLLTQSTALAAFILFAITFLESIAIVGILIPSAVIMTAVGVLIAQNYFNFYLAWFMAFLGCFMGDVLSFLLGGRFKQVIMQWSWIKKQESLITKTEKSLLDNRFTSIILGRYIGVLRPIVPLLAGILNLKLRDFIIPSFIACVSWPILYLLPGIFAGAATEFPKDVNPRNFQLILAMSVLLMWLIYFLSKKAFKFQQNQNKIGGESLSTIRAKINRLLTLKVCLATIGIGFITLIFLVISLVKDPLFSLYIDILAKVFQS